MGRRLQELLRFFEETVLGICRGVAHGFTDRGVKGVARPTSTVYIKCASLSLEERPFGMGFNERYHFNAYYKIHAF